MFANSILLALFQNVILDRVMFDKNQIEVIFYLGSKWVIKQQRQFATSAMHLAQELLTDIQCNGGSRSFKGHEKLEDEHSGWPAEVDNDQLRGSLRPILTCKLPPKAQCQQYGHWSAFEAN